jgi:hypothetical protein
LPAATIVFADDVFICDYYVLALRLLMVMAHMLASFTFTYVMLSSFALILFLQ